MGNIYKFIRVGDLLRKLNMYRRILEGGMWTVLLWWASPIRWRDLRFLSEFGKTSEVEINYIGRTVKRITLEGIFSFSEGWMSLSNQMIGVEDTKKGISPF